MERRPRAVSISEFEITSVNLPEVHFRVVCSKGTYIRSLAHDFGAALQAGGHLSALRRTRSGDFHVNDAFKVMELVNHIKSMRFESKPL